MMTQVVDASDPVLGFLAGWVDALAAHVDRLDVLCLRASAGERPANVLVHRIGSAPGSGRVRRFVTFERRVARLAPRADVIFSHMVPRYAWCAGPFAAAWRRPMVLWYTHRQDSLELRLASAFCRAVATAAPSSFPFATPKLHVLGHGVDTRVFAPDPAVERASPPVILFVGRITPVKRQATLVEALTRLHPVHAQARALFVGPEDGGSGYARDLRRAVGAAGLAHRVEFAGPLAPMEVRDWYRRSTAAVNLSPDGLFDKAALESMMTGTPTIVASAAFDGLLPSSAPWLRLASGDDPASLAAALDRVLSLAPGERQHLADGISARAAACHGLDRFMPRLVALMRALAG
jgi:glycosyltransferase involved in cell wall biosynthesis